MEQTNLLYPQPVRSETDQCRPEQIFFAFEEDFVEENVRCIPMIVRFKLDACGIKLKLSEWSKMTVEERKRLSEMTCADSNDLLHYRYYLQQIILLHTGVAATDLPVDWNPEWENINELPPILKEKLSEFSWFISLRKWRRLNNLQRFVLLKLCRPGHENKNFPKAMKEFGLV
ncbi:MAG: nitrate reductase associated protein [Chitinophagaceae bacterium]